MNLLSPITLLAGNIYVLGARFPAGSDIITINSPAFQPGFDPAVSSGNAREATGVGFQFPNLIDGPGSIIGPNALFSVVANGNGNAVPEGGSTAVFFALALGGLTLGKLLPKSRN